MFSVYGVRIINDKKDRHHIGTYEDREHAISICRRLDCDYGYVKEFGGSTVYYLPIKLGYYEHRGPPLIMKSMPPEFLGQPSIFPRHSGTKMRFAGQICTSFMSIMLATRCNCLPRVSTT